MKLKKVIVSRIPTISAKMPRSSLKCKQVDIPKQFAHAIYAGGETVCSRVFVGSEYDVRCWGDDTGQKYSLGFVPTEEISEMVLGAEFACAEVKTAVADHYQ